MSPAISYAVMFFGAAVAIAGLILLFLRGQEEAESSFELFGQKVRVTSTGLLVFIVGCGLLVAPFYLPTVPQDKKSEQTPERFGTSNQNVGIYVPDRIFGKQKEPNNTRKEANQIEIDKAYMGQLIEPEDADFFVFILPPNGPRNLIVETSWLSFAESAEIQMFTAYGREIDAGLYLNARPSQVRQGFIIDADNAYYLTLHPVGADFPFVYEIKVERSRST